MLLSPLTKDFLDHHHAFYGKNDPLGIPVSDILNLAESPHRLPARFANELYLRGETSMGCFSFTVSFYSGIWRHYVGSNGGVDFIAYPALMSPRWVRSVVDDRRTRYHNCPDAKFCYFKE